MLGCKLRADGSPTSQLRRRVALGAQLYHAGVAPLLLLAGGGVPVSEAQAMGELAAQAGVPALALIREPWSRNTAENAIHSARLLNERGLRRVVLVSHRTHLFRARLLFRMSGLTIVGAAGVPSRSTISAVLAILYEAAALPRSIIRMLQRRI